MKNSVKVLVGLLIAPLIYSCAHQAPPTSNHYIYSFENPSLLSAKDSTQIIQKFLGKRDVGDLYKSNENTVYFVSKEEVSETLEHDLNTGNFTFNKSMRKYKGDFVPKLPASQEAIMLAQKFLEQNGMRPKVNDELKIAHIGGVRASSVIDGKKPGPVIDKLVTVTYGRAIGNLPVIGPGSKIVVKLGDSGEVMGAIHRWREINPSSKKLVPPEEIISSKEAEEMAKRQIMAEYGGNTAYRILGSGEAYYDNNGRLLQPVYTFEVSISMQDKRVKPFNYLCVIPMLKNSPEPLNLTAVDPKAKTLLKSIKRGETAPNENTGEKSTSD